MVKNIKGCQVVQTNWMPALNSKIIEDDFEVFTKLLDEIKAVEEDIDIFKKSNYSQFMKQAEIDVIGIRLFEGNVKELFLIDSAFHENGLGYKDNIGTVSKKLIRAVGVAKLFFNNINTKIMFVSPYARDSVVSGIEEQVNKIKAITSKYYLYIELEILFNNDFVERMYMPLIELANDYSNDNDLFMRNVKLIKLCEEIKTPNKEEPSVLGNKATSGSSLNRPKNEVSVIEILNKLKDAGRLNDYVLNQLQSGNYTKQMFKISTFPFLIKESEFNKSKFKNDRKRFYKGLFKVKDIQFLVCSQWIPERVDLLEKWFNKMME